MQGCRGGGEQGISPQSAAPVRPGVLRAGEGYRPAGRYPGTQQCEHHKDLHHGVRVYPPEAFGAAAASGIKEKPRNYSSVVKRSNYILMM